MSTDSEIYFGPYRLSGSQGLLYEGNMVLPLRPKAFAVLWALASRSGNVVSKESLTSIVWPNQYVSEGSLAVCMRDIRKVLNENTHQPRYIQTLHRRGYRFIGRRATHKVIPDSNFIGRSRELAVLNAELRLSLAGECRIVMLSGESGIGKSELIRYWTNQHDVSELAQFVTGCCVEQFGSGEAYLPFLNCIATLCNRSDDSKFVDLLRQIAPTWFSLFPSFQSSSERLASAELRAQFTMERMQRELGDLLEAISAWQPLVLILEDMQWCDGSSISALSLLANRSTHARLLLIVTFRTSGTRHSENMFWKARTEMLLHKKCRELLLDRLNESDVGSYVKQRFNDPRVHALKEVVYTRSEGNPLFMEMLCDEIATSDPVPVVSAFSDSVPVSVIDFIKLQTSSLTKETLAVIEAASIAGVEFDTEEVLAALGDNWHVEMVEEICNALSQRGEFIEEQTVKCWPDGSLATRYRFRHALYPQVISDLIGQASRARMHLAIAKRLELGFSDVISSMSNLLAWHYERGQDSARSLHFLLKAAEEAQQRCANLEMRVVLEKALSLLPAAPFADNKVQLELQLLLQLGPVVTSLEGYASSEVSRIYNRARQLCTDESVAEHRVQVLRGISSFFVLRAEYTTAYEIGVEILQTVEPASQTIGSNLDVEGHLLCGIADYFRGRFDSAGEEFQRSISLYSTAIHRNHAAKYGMDPGCLGLSFSAACSWMSGTPAVALEHANESINLAVASEHPFTLSQCHSMVAFMHQLRGDVALTRLHSEHAARIAQDHEFAFLVASERARQGWILVQEKHFSDGIEYIIEGSQLYAETGAIAGLPAINGTLAEAYLNAGKLNEGLVAVKAAASMARENGEGLYLAELQRLQGEIELAIKPDSAQHRFRAEAHFRSAIELSQMQNAKAWEVRSAASLASMLFNVGDAGTARSLMRPLTDDIHHYLSPKGLARILSIFDR